MSTAARLALSALLLVASAARAAEFDCPARGGPAWREVRTTHFSLQTDLDSGAARDLGREVERLYEAVRYSLFRQPPETPGLIRVVALRGFEFELFAPRDAGAFYVSQTVLGPTVVMPGYLGEAQRAIIAHELTHHLLARTFARRPLWFSEGMACYMETVGTSGISSSPTRGGQNAWRYRKAFPYHGGMAAVLTSRGPLDERGYGMAWALVHFLFNRKEAEFGELQARFARGQDPATAWREVFPAWDPSTPAGASALDDAVGRYLYPRSGEHKYWPIQLPPIREVTERPLTAGEAHALRLSLPWFNRGDAKAVRAEFDAEVDEALGHDPGNLVALRLLSERKGQEGKALELAERAVALHPDDARAWLFLSSSLPAAAGQRRLEALARAAALDPGNATALNDSAWLLLADGRSGEALPLARQAATLEPTSAPILDTLAGVLEDLGRCQDALGVQHRAVDVLPERANEGYRRSYLERLGRLEKECGVRPSAAAQLPGAGG